MPPKGTVRRYRVRKMFATVVDGERTLVTNANVNKLGLPANEREERVASGHLEEQWVPQEELEPAEESTTSSEE